MSLYRRNCVLAASFAALVSLPARLPLQGQVSASVAPLTKAQIVKLLDPQMLEVVTLLNQIRGTSLLTLSPQDARQQFGAEDAAKVLEHYFGLAEKPLPVGKITDGLAIDGPDGNKIPIRIYTPTGEGPFPVVLYFHGGGFVIATIDTYDASARELCDYANAIVVSVEYRKAPEAPFPAARRDAIASYEWAIANIAGYNGISSKIAVAGESAGGNLAAEVAITALNRGLQMPTHQLLVYPVTSTNVTQASDLLYTNAFLPLNTAALTYFYMNYLPDPSLGTDPRVSPIAANLKSLPPTTIIAAQLDPLQSDGQAYAAKLQAAGVPVTYQLYSGVTHEFFGMGAIVDTANTAEHFAARQLSASFQ